VLLPTKRSLLQASVVSVLFDCLVKAERESCAKAKLNNDKTVDLGFQD
jgi:hypothetical protein